MFVQVGELGGAVVVAKLKHLRAKAVGLPWDGQCHPVCFTRILKCLFCFGIKSHSVALSDLELPM